MKMIKPVAPFKWSEKELLLMSQLCLNAWKNTGTKN